VVGDVEQTALGPFELVRSLGPLVLFVGALRQLVIGLSAVREALVRRPFQVIGDSGHPVALWVGRPKADNQTLTARDPHPVAAQVGGGPVALYLPSDTVTIELVQC
jgi:hypothetical protein